MNPSPVTPQSIALAKQSRDQERDLIYRVTGLRITGDGTIAHPVRREQTHE